MKVSGARLTIAPRFLLILCFVLISCYAFAQATMGNGNINTTIKLKNSSQAPVLEYNFNSTDWYYVAFTKPSSGSGAFYINGEFVGSINWASMAYDHSILNIGASFFSSFSGYFSGTIDELRVTNKIKDASDLKAHFDTDAAFANETETAFIWRFDEGAGTQFVNEANDLIGNLSGSPLWVDGKFGKAIKYDGIDDRARVNADLAEYQVTYEFWVKFDGEVRGTSQTLIQPYGGTSSSIDLTIEQTLIAPAREDVVFSLPSPSAAKDEEILMPVTVEKFIDILTVQQTISWDPAVLEYQGVSDFLLTDLDENDFNLFSPGKLTLSWTPSDLNVVTVSDQSTIFNLVFKAIGDGGATTNVMFGDDPTPREISDGDANVLNAVYNDGSVSIIADVALGGYIRTQAGEALQGVEVELTGALQQTTMTDEFGWYSFDVTPGFEYHITPNYEVAGGADDGVSTLDLVIMQWHILGMRFMMSNYDLIACDVNQSGSLTTMDVAQSRAVILHMDEAFGNRPAIEFINHEYTGYPDVFDYQNFITIIPTVAHTDLDFIAVKLGDAGRNWQANASGNGRKEELHDLDITLDIETTSDNRVNMSFKSTDFRNIVGLQFTLEWDPEVYRFERLQDRELQFIANLNMLDEGKLTVVWNDGNLEGKTLDEQAVLSAIEFSRLADSKDIGISISSGVTPALAFNSGMETLAIKGNSLMNELAKEKLSVYPNPASGVLRLKTNDDDMPDYSIKNATGITIKTGRLNPDREIDIENLDKGIYFLQIKNKDKSVENAKFIKQ
jgi:hypothetical protein